MKLIKSHSVCLGLVFLGIFPLSGACHVSRAQAKPSRIKRPSTTCAWFQGQVTTNLLGNDFVLHTRKGPFLQVRAINGKPPRLSLGDSVRVTGRFNAQGDIFLAEKVKVLRNN